MLFECKDFEKEIRTIKKLNQSLLKEDLNSKHLEAYGLMNSYSKDLIMEKRF